MSALDSHTLLAKGIRITLWGIMPPTPSASPFDQKAVDLLDSLVGTDDVNCKVMSGVAPDVVAVCTVRKSIDLGLELIGHGFAVVDRRQMTADSAFASTYNKAQEVARLNDRGIWRLVAAEDRDSRVPTWLQPYLPILVPLALVGGPLSGLLITLVMMRYWLRKMENQQKDERDRANRQQSIVTARERYVLISTLEGELTANRNKVGAFILIYNDMLRSFQNKDAEPKYQRVGDIVQQRPHLSKTVFEANLAKLSLLDMRLAGLLSRLYTSLPSGHEYTNLDPHVPLEIATQIVQGVIKEAESLVPGLDQAIKALEAEAATNTPNT
jgi:hypothetical protein